MLATAAASCAASAQLAAPLVAGTESGRSATDVIRYRVRVDAPSAIAEAIASAVDLIRWQDFPDMTEDLLDRLARLAVTQAREAAATQGYFSANVEITIERTSDPVLITLSVEPNEPTRIGDLQLTVTGPAADDVSAGTAAIARMHSEWRLPRGDVFRQSAWDEAKEHALATLAASPYAAAKIIASEARIDPAAHSAALSVEIESGPPFRFGRIDVLGLARYTPGLVRDFSPIHPGERYDQQALDDYVRRLLASGYFASAQAAIEPDPARADDATVTINVIEAPSRRLELGAGYSTDTRYRASASYSDVNIDNRGLQLHADARIESKVQSAQLRFVRPPAPGGWIDTFASSLARTDIENLVERTASVTARRRSLNERSTPAFGAGFHASEEAPEGASRDRAHAFFVDGEYTWRRVDDLLAPTRGVMANAQAGVGIPGVSSRGFLRFIGRTAAWWPLGRETQLKVRADVGASSPTHATESPPTFCSAPAAIRRCVATRSKVWAFSAGRRSSAGATTQWAARKSRAGSTRVWALPRSSMPATPRIRSRASLRPLVTARVCGSRPPSDRSVSTSLTEKKPKKCASTFRWVSRFDLSDERTNARVRPPRGEASKAP